MKVRLTKPLLFRWANHHDKDFKPGDLEVTFTLPIGTEVELEGKRQMCAGRLYNYVDLTVCDISFTHPLSEVTAHAILNYLE